MSACSTQCAWSMGEAAVRNPCTDGDSGLLRDFELHRSSGLPLNNHRPIADATRKGYVSNSNGDQVATSELAVNGEVKERQIPFRA